MPILTSDTFRPAEFILSEASGQRSRENITFTQTGVAVKSGTVIARLTATGKYVTYDDVGTDGSEVAAGILYSPLSAATGDTKAVAFVRDCEVIRAALIGLNAGGTTDLQAVGVIVRGTV